MIIKSHFARRAMSFSTTGKYSIFLLIFVCIFGFYTFALAQTGELFQTDINVDIVPENPKPNEQVRATITSYGTNINTANISWKVNGKAGKSGIGEKVFDFVVGDINTTTIVDIKIETREGEVVDKTLAIKPSSVDLIWQSDGFVPPFYKGKALFSHQNKITFIAMPHITSPNGSEFPVKNLIYKWKKNGSVIEPSSGYGKNTYTITGPLISRPFQVTVEVTTQNTNDVGMATTYVNPVEPSVVFYDKNPIYGIEFQKALLGTVKLTEVKELTVVVVPYFFGIKNPDTPELAYKWKINGAPINNGSQSSQVFRQKEGTNGTSNISLSIENSDKILQFTKGQFNLEFGEDSSE